MDNQIKSKTRLAAIQLVAQQLVNKQDIETLKSDFDKNYRNKILEVGGEKIQYNINFLSKLINYYKSLDFEFIINQIKSFKKFDRKFENWDTIIKAIIFVSISEILNTKNTKLIIVLNDYINISKFFVNLKETKLINLILDKLINEK